MQSNSGKNKRSSLYKLAFVLLAVVLSMALIVGCGNNDDDDSHSESAITGKTVTTGYGDLKGTATSDVWIWKGIPYAAPPVGNLRWKAPTDPDAWDGVRDAGQACDECLQQVYTSQWFPSNAFIGSEDCLYLDIYAPRTEDTDLPVYVYIHGGSGNFDSAKKYDGSALAERGHIIVVYVQYRLNAMGFITHSALRQNGNDLDDSGNYGLLDIQKALEWVQENIAAFGGDPDLVTVGGQSAGAHNIMNLIVSPVTTQFATDLFRGAFMQSVAGPGTMTLSTVSEADARTNTTIDGLLIRNGLAADATAAVTYRAGMSDFKA
ncbi:MAG: carboxylesterase family protein [Proteobacteria bacterium]|nr:carboxylesterase family protein [Pseudomonadota bacterium]